MHMGVSPVCLVSVFQVLHSILLSIFVVYNIYNAFQYIICPAFNVLGGVLAPETRNRRPHQARTTTGTIN
jgi:hypothetical protein